MNRQTEKHKNRHETEERSDASSQLVMSQLALGIGVMGGGVRVRVSTQHKCDRCKRAIVSNVIMTL